MSKKVTMEDILVIIDPGHGGVTKEGVYTTAPSKMYTFPTGEVIYEGERNRVFASALADELFNLNINYIFTVDPLDPTDMPLKSRTDIENEYRKKGYTTLFFSMHSNAGKGTGFEIFTSVGETLSDKLATFIGREIMYMFPEIAFRKDTTDGDLDKEENFYVLRKTIGEAVLFENLFFDRFSDYLLLRSQEYRKCLSLAIAQGINLYIQSQYVNNK